MSIKHLFRSVDLCVFSGEVGIDWSVARVSRHTYTFFLVVWDWLIGIWINRSSVYLGESASACVWGRRHSNFLAQHDINFKYSVASGKFTSAVGLGKLPKCFEKCVILILPLLKDQ